MLVAHLRVPDGGYISAKRIKAIIEYIETVQWIESNVSFAIDTDCEVSRFLAKTNLDAFTGEVLTDHQHSIINFGKLGDFVSNRPDTHVEYGLIINTVLQDPSLFFIDDGYVRVAHINFDFEPYTEFLFSDGKLRLTNLTESDKTLLRLGHNRTKIAKPDGTFFEKIH